tara:strand:- start:2478 stop:3185 length:708 start_codon:yes stop_codon:yes gene_type:complete
MNILIPMAGAGSRFAAAGYTLPKPLIDVSGTPMIQTVVENLGYDATYIFVVQVTHYHKYDLGHFLESIAPGCKIVLVDKMTDGAACTTLLARDYITNDDHLLIVNSDNVFDWDNMTFLRDATQTGIDGCILVFNGTNPKWSFAKTDESGRVTEVAEKIPISDIATAGAYFWAKGSDYVKAADQMIEKDIRTNNEFYVCPVYNELINGGGYVTVSYVDKMWGLGTPEDLQYYLEHH